MEKYLNNNEIDIIIQHSIYDYSFKELSLKYNKSINTIISIYHRAIKKYLKGVGKNEKK
jgi:DNA-directed RNA polymerase specialized sigma24 family protein